MSLRLANGWSYTFGSSGSRGFKLGPADVNFYSSKDPTAVETARQEQHLDILRNATTNPPDRVKEFTFKATGGSLSPLFDGKEKLLSWDNILWLRSWVQLP